MQEVAYPLYTWLSNDSDANKPTQNNQVNMFFVICTHLKAHLLQAAHFLVVCTLVLPLHPLPLAEPSRTLWVICGHAIQHNGE